MKIILSAMILCALSCPWTVQAQTAAVPATATLQIDGAVRKALQLTAADLKGLPRQQVQTQDHTGSSVHFEGVALSDVLELAGVTLGKSLRGERLASFLLVEAADGYRAVFALPELDPLFTDQVILLADRRDGQALSAQEGPWRIVIPHEKRQARWLRQVTTLRIQQLEAIQ